MSTFNFTVGNNQVSIAAGQLTKGLKLDLATLTFAADVLAALANRPLSDIAGDFLEVKFTADKQFSWDHSFDAGGTLTVTFEPQAEAKLVLRKAGVLLKFADDAAPQDEDLPLAPPAPATVLPGQAYVSILLNVGLSASGQGGFTSGNFGFKANAGTDQRFLLAYHHAIPASTTVTDALKAAFEGFVLPYNTEKIQDLAPGCYSEYEHIGKYNFSADATFGYSGTLLAGVSKQALASAHGTEIGKIAFKAKPEFKLGATATFSYSHEDAFRVVASSPDAGHIGLYYFKMDQSKFSLGFSVEARIALNADATLETKLTAAAKDAITKLVPAQIPGATQLIGKLTDKLPTAEVDKAVAGAQNSVKDFLKTVEKKLVASASVTFERISVHTALMSYRFDRNTGKAAFETAMKGDLLGIAQMPGVAVAEGSFIRDSLTKRISFGFRIFGLEATSFDEFVKSSEIAYEGDGIFRLRFTRGRNAQTDFFGHQRQVEILFTATTEAMGRGQIRESDIRMRITLFDKNDAEAAGFAAATIRQTAPSAADLMASAIRNNPAGAYKVVCSIAPSAFGKLTFTPFEKPRRPQTFSHQVEDGANYESFLRAFNVLYHSHIRTFFPESAMRYADWAQLNLELNDQLGQLLNANSRPNRRARVNTGTQFGAWPQNGRLAVVPQNTRSAVFNDLEAARQFMNCCEDLAVLGKELAEATTEAAFEELLEGMETLAKKETGGAFPVFYTKPTLAALLDRMSPKVSRLDVPADDKPRDEFDIRIDLV